MSMNVPNNGNYINPYYYNQTNTTIGSVSQPYPVQQYGYSNYAQNSYQVNAALKSQVLAKPAEYTELKTFKVPHIGTGKLYKLDNGQKVVIIPKKGPTTIKSFAKVGSFNETDNIRGISHFIEHNLFNGSKLLKPNEFVEIVNGRGSRYNASTGYANTDYFITSPLHGKQDFEQFVKIHADMIENPSFLPSMLEKEKGPVISEIQMYKDSPYDKAQNTMLKNLFSIKADYQGLIAGPVKNIQNVSKQEVENYFNTWYTPDNLTTVVVGDIKPNEAIKLVSQNFNSNKKSTGVKYHEDLSNVIQKTKRVDLKSPNINSVMTVMGFVGPKNNDVKNTLASNALITALVGHNNAKLTQALKPLNTDADMGLNVVSNNGNDPQTIELSADFAVGEEEKGLKAIYSSIFEMTQKPINNEELIIVKNKLKNALLNQTESSMDLAALVGNAVVNEGSIDAFSNMEENINALTAQDVQRAAVQFLNLNKTSISVIHPEKQIIGQSQKISKPAFKGGISFRGYSSKFNLGDIKEYNLSNNIRLAMNESNSSTKTSLNFELKTDKTLNVKPGVSEILSAMLNKGSGIHSEENMNKIFDLHNVYVGAAADADGISFSVDTPDTNKVGLGMDLLKEVLLNPNFSQENFQKAKDELKVAYQALPKNAVSRSIENLYKGHPYGTSTKDVLNNINNITIDDIKNLYSTVLANSQARVSVTKPVNAQSVEIVNKLQMGLPVFKPYSITNLNHTSELAKTKLSVQIEDRKQAHIAQSFKINESGNIKDKAAMLLFNKVLGGTSQSRLFQDLREKQKLAYMVGSKCQSVGDKSSVLLLNIKTSTKDIQNGKEVSVSKNIQKSLDGFKKHLDLLKTALISNEELESAKLSLKSDLIFSAESTQGKNSLVSAGLNTYYGADYAEDLMKTIENITPNDIQNFAVNCLNKPSSISIVASKDALEENKEYLTKLS